MAVRTGKITWVDTQGIEHAVEVSAQSVYEAVAQALRVFREHEWCQDLRHTRQCCCEHQPAGSRA
jgi:hypothetical protein